MHICKVTRTWNRLANNLTELIIILDFRVFGLHKDRLSPDLGLYNFEMLGQEKTAHVLSCLQNFRRLRELRAIKTATLKSEICNGLIRLHHGGYVDIHCMNASLIALPSDRFRIKCLKQLT